MASVVILWHTDIRKGKFLRACACVPLCVCECLSASVCLHMRLFSLFFQYLSSESSPEDTAEEEESR